MTKFGLLKTTDGSVKKSILYAAVLVSVLSVIAFWILNNPDICLLTPDRNADWIRLPEPYILHARTGAETQTEFYRQFNLDKVSDKSTLILRAFRSPQVSVNGREISSSGSAPDNWKKRKSYDLTPALKTGTNEIRITVKNRNSHPALWAYCREAGLSTDSSWLAGSNGAKRIRAQNVTHPVTIMIFSLATIPVVSPDIVKISMPCREAFLDILPLLAIIFGVVFLLVLSTNPKVEFINKYFTASAMRFGVMAAYLILAANNFLKFPVFMGFDVKEHLAYIQYISDHISLPLASQGWEFFQAPLFYMISAFVFKAGMALSGYAATLRLLHVIPLLCGLVQIEIGYRTMKIAFSENKNIQILGTLICGILPMNIYMSQTIGNEQLSGVLTAVVLYLCIKQHYAPDKNFSIATGVFLGLALLAKVSALLLIPLVVINYMLDRKDSRSCMRPAFTSFVIAFLISGWFYIRNYLYFDNLVLDGCGPLYMSWWQDPGFRLIGHFTSFGASLVRPAFSYVRGFWDALYASFWLDGYFLSKAIPPFPPWNYKWMFSCAWLALPATLAFIFSFCRSFNYISRPVLVLSRSAFLIYLFAMLYMYLTLPMYSIARATFTLGLLPVYGILITTGLSPLMKYKISRAVVFGWLACFGTCVYLSYFII